MDLGAAVAERQRGRGVYVFDGGVPGAPMPVGFYARTRTAAPSREARRCVRGSGVLDSTVYLSPRTGQDAAGSARERAGELNGGYPAALSLPAWTWATRSGCRRWRRGGPSDHLRDLPAAGGGRAGLPGEPTPVAGTSGERPVRDRGGDLHVPRAQRARGGDDLELIPDVPLAARLRLPLWAGVEPEQDVRLETEPGGDLALPERARAAGRHYVAGGRGHTRRRCQYDTTLVDSGATTR